jgi:uncharacterized delta-60 repeat protein
MRRALAGKLGFAGVAAWLLLAGAAQAAPGDLDTTFSDDGRATLNLGGMEDVYWADVASTPDGGSVVVGTTQSTFGQPLAIGIAKLRPNGSFDPKFSDDGKLILTRGSGAYAYAVAAQPDGKIVISGTHDEGGIEYMDIVRVNANGTLDSSFGGGGFRSINFGTPLEEGYDVAVAPDGKIVAAGYAGEYHPQTQTTPALADFDITVVRLNSNGIPDTSFSGDGVV